MAIGQAYSAPNSFDSGLIGPPLGCKPYMNHDTTRPCGFDHQENACCVVCAVYERDMADIAALQEGELARLEAADAVRMANAKFFYDQVPPVVRGSR